MCDYSLSAAKTRKAEVGDKLVTRNFDSGFTGFTLAGGDKDEATCLLPGTELAFDAPIRESKWTYWGIESVEGKVYSSVAVFGQVNKNIKHTHHDQLQFADGECLLLINLAVDQTATVLQLPAAPKNEAEVEAQTRAEFVG